MWAASNRNLNKDGNKIRGWRAYIDTDDLEGLKSSHKILSSEQIEIIVGKPEDESLFLLYFGEKL